MDIGSIASLLTDSPHGILERAIYSHHLGIERLTLAIRQILSQSIMQLVLIVIKGADNSVSDVTDTKLSFHGRGLGVTNSMVRIVIIQWKWNYIKITYLFRHGP